MKYKIVVDENGEIKVDEEVSNDESCWTFYTSTNDYKGYGVIASSREICVKKINKIFKDKIKEREKKLETLRKVVARFEK